MDLDIIDIGKDSDFFIDVKYLFDDLYKYLDECGLFMPLSESGSDLWLKSIGNVITGKYGILKGAVSENKLIGFINGIIRFSPQYIGGHKVGYITHLYVLPTIRNSGVGKALYENIEEWFWSKKVHSIEIQVLCSNLGGIDFWNKMSFKKELLQMRKFNTNNTELTNVC